ncbi:MAG: metallophosphoesterase [Myxococcota bacterium]|nr:metallophosphoesterase [Myxococcota bacterium]
MTTSTADGDIDRVAPKAPAGRRRTSRFLRLLLAITVVVHVPVALGVTEWARRAHWWQPELVGAGWAVLGVALFLGRARAGMPDRRRHDAFVRLVDIPYFIHWCAAVWAFLPSVAATVIGPAVDLARRAQVHLPMGWYLGSYASGLVVCGYGILVRRRWFRVVEREVQVTGLDPRLDGLRIAQLSDLHVGTLTPRPWGLRWTKAANRRAPDLAVVTGDMVTSGTEYHADVADVVGSLRAKLGVFASMGNHDYFGEGEPLISLLGNRGVRVLRNAGIVIERDGATLWLAGIDDTWTRRDDLARALRDRPTGATTVLLAHDPESFDEAVAAGVELVLSGHTHGGQIGVPFIYRWVGLANLAHRYRVGFYRRGRSALYVHPGLGTTGPPLRLGVAPEVTILVLKSA